jgi:hypothetical protein
LSNFLDVNAIFPVVARAARLSDGLQRFRRSLGVGLTLDGVDRRRRDCLPKLRADLA